MKVKAALPAKENQQDGLTTFSKAYFLWINFNASALYFELGAKYACRKANLLREIRLLLAYRCYGMLVTDDRVCCENIAAAMFVTVKEMRAGPS